MEYDGKDETIKELIAKKSNCGDWIDLDPQGQLIHTVKGPSYDQVNHQVLMKKVKPSIFVNFMSLEAILTDFETNQIS